MITDPLFYAAAVPAVLIFGIAKGGFGGGLGVIAVPLMALVVSPVLAAAIMLPILCVMDLFAIRRYWGRWDRSELRVLVPASLVGIAVGTALFGYLTAAAIRLVIGAVAISFTLHYWIGRYGKGGRGPADLPRYWGLLGGGGAGFTSFVAHAGGPPVSMYLLRRPIDRGGFVATTVFFFAVVNYVKLVPYYWLGQLDADNLTTALVLMPLAPIGIELGHYLNRRATDRFFFGLMYVVLFVVGIKLIYDGLLGH